MTLQATEAHVLQVEVFIYAVRGPFTADAALLDATERGDLSCNEAFVDADHAALERPRNAKGRDRGCKNRRTIRIRSSWPRQWLPARA